MSQVQGGVTTIDTFLRSAAAVDAIDPALALTIGSVLDDCYELRERLGAGGMATVYRAHDRRLNREVAIKVPRLGGDRARTLAMFEREAQATARLGHPNIVALHQLGDHQGTQFAVLELLTGETLAERLARRHVLPAAEAIAILDGVLLALAYAHERGIVHRDLTPRNVFLTTDERVKLLDFGVAIEHGRIAGTHTRAAGTPGYMAPEHAVAADPRNDLWAAGVLFLECVTGQRPGAGEASEVPSELPGEVRDMIARAVDRDPERRPATASDMRSALVDRVVASRPRRARRRRWLAATVLACVAIAGAGFALRDDAPGVLTPCDGRWRWLKASPYAFHGIPRGFHNWTTTPYNDNFLAIGTENKLYIEAGANFYDITPLRENTPVLSTPDTNNAMSVFIGDPHVVVTTGVPHGLELVNSFVTVAGVVGPIGGVPASEFNGNHQVRSIENVNQFTYLLTTPPTATVLNAGGTAITISFEIEPGLAINTGGYGWGAGPWGRNAWGVGSDVPIQLSQRDWFYDNIDNDLVANIRHGAIYYWTRGTSIDPVVPLSQRAVLLSSLAAADGYDPDAVPSLVMQVIMSQQDRHLIAFGAVPFGSTDPLDFDPLLIRWADQDNWTQWTPETLNSAGFIKVSRGSRIMRALPTKQEFLVWTDAKLYALQFLGTTDVFGVQEYAETISLMSSRAVITASNITYWMGTDKFYAYTGRVETVPCTLLDHVFQNFNFGQAEEVVTGVNEEWNEVWWFYPSAGASYNDSYVIYNYMEQNWYYGTINRSAWLDSPLRRYPQAARLVAIPPNLTTPTPMSYLMNHEVGTDDDLLPMNSYIQSNDFDLGDGDNFMLTRRLIPDVNFVGSTVSDPEVKMQILPRNFPGSDPFPDIEDTQLIASTNVNNYTQQVFMRARARQMAFRIMSDKLGVSWQLGNCRLDVRPDGRR